MKILLTNFHTGNGGGHDTYLMALAQHLGARHSVWLAVPPDSALFRKALSLPKVQVLAQPFPNGLKNIWQTRRARRQLAHCLRQHRFDVVHVNGSADHRLVLGALGGLAPKPRVVLTKHNSKAISGLSSWYRARGTDLAIAVSDHTRAMLTASAYTRCQPTTVRNGVDTDYFKPWEQSAADEIRRHYGLEDRLVVGSNAGTADHKRWMDMAEAIKKLPPIKARKVHILLCGSPPTAGQMERVRALDLSSRSILPDCWKMCGPCWQRWTRALCCLMRWKPFLLRVGK